MWNLDKALLFQETRFFVWKIEKFDGLQLPQSSIFFAETSHLFPTDQCPQKCVRDFFYLFRSWVVCKNQKGPGFYIIVFYIFINNSRSKQNLKNPEHTFVNIVN